MTHITKDQDLAAKKRFEADTTDHQMTVLHDDGLYRHLHFQGPEHGFYWFDVITWPGHLTLNGDMGCWTFRRTEDMFEFFRDSRGLTRINPGYWGEKLIGGNESGNRLAERYDGDTFVKMVNDHIEEYLSESQWPEAVKAELRRQIAVEVLEDDFGNKPPADESLARQGLRDFRFTHRRAGIDYEQEFCDTWEWDLKIPTGQFLWSCWAIVHAIAAYDAHKAPKEEGDPMTPADLGQLEVVRS